jgi:hypothetical protein
VVVSGLPNITPIFMRIWLIKITVQLLRLILPVPAEQRPPACWRQFAWRGVLVEGLENRLAAPLQLRVDPNKHFSSKFLKEFHDPSQR